MTQKWWDLKAEDLWHGTLRLFWAIPYHIFSGVKFSQRQMQQRGIRVFLQGWVINTLAVLVAVYIVEGIRYEKPLDLVVASLVLGILNAVIRPLLMFLALPLLVVTLGLFTFVINALLLYFVGYILRPHFSVDNFWAALFGAVIIGIMSVVLNTLTGTGQSRIHIQRKRDRPPGDDSGPGPIIEI